MVQSYVTNPIFLAPTFVFLSPNLATSMVKWFFPDLALLIFGLDLQENKNILVQRGLKKHGDMSLLEEKKAVILRLSARTSLEELEAFVFFFTWETEQRGFAFPVGKQLSNFPVSRFSFSHALRV